MLGSLSKTQKEGCDLPTLSACMIASRDNQLPDLHNIWEPRTRLPKGHSRLSDTQPTRHLPLRPTLTRAQSPKTSAQLALQRHFFRGLEWHASQAITT